MAAGQVSETLHTSSGAPPLVQLSVADGMKTEVNAAANPLLESRATDCPSVTFTWRQGGAESIASYLEAGRGAGRGAGGEGGGQGGGVKVAESQQVKEKLTPVRD